MMTQRWFRIATSVIFAVFVAAGVFAANPNAQPQPNVTLTFPSEVVAGTAFTLTATVTDPTTNALVTDGAIQFEQLVVATDPITLITTSTWTSFTDDIDLLLGNGTASVTLKPEDLGWTIGCYNLRAHYKPKQPGSSIYASNMSPQITLCVTAGCASPVVISADMVSGSGQPYPGGSGTWSFRITVHACRDAYGVTAQGGTSGWSKFTSASASTGAWAIRKDNGGKTQILKWTIGDMPAGSTATLLVSVAGPIANTSCTTQYINGPWSATYSYYDAFDVYTTTKSTYTGRMSFTTTGCP